MPLWRSVRPIGSGSVKASADLLLPPGEGRNDDVAILVARIAGDG
jgi:hypothetical protein